MKKLVVSSLFIFIFCIGVNASNVIIHENGKPKVTQDGNQQSVTIDCNWMWWKECWSLYDDGYLRTGDGRVFGNAGVVSSSTCENPEDCEYRSRTTFTFEPIE